MNIKKLIAIAAASAFILLPYARTEKTKHIRPVTASAESHALGDVNGDTMIDGKDASRILVIYSQLSAGVPVAVGLDEFNASDVDADGRLTAKDASHILAYYSYLSTGGTSDITTYIRSAVQPEATTAPATTAPAQTTTSATGYTVLSPTLGIPAVTLTATGDDSVKLSWDKVEDAERYNLDFSQKADFSFINTSVSTNVTSY